MPARGGPLSSKGAKTDKLSDAICSSLMKTFTVITLEIITLT